jgi:hypothetical protein
MAGSIIPLHEGKRVLVSEEYMSAGSGEPDLHLVVAVLRSLTEGDQSVVHMQKVLVRADGTEINKKGGLILPTCTIPDLKRAIDKAYMVCVENGLFDEGK